MDIIPGTLLSATLEAQHRLAAGAHATAASAAAPGGFARTQATMAQAASAAVFADALLGALHARVNEARAATR